MTIFAITKSIQFFFILFPERDLFSSIITLGGCGLGLDLMFEGTGLQLWIRPKSEIPLRSMVKPDQRESKFVSWSFTEIALYSTFHNIRMQVAPAFHRRRNSYKHCIFQYKLVFILPSRTPPKTAEMFRPSLLLKEGKTWQKSAKGNEEISLKFYPRDPAGKKGKKPALFSIVSQRNFGAVNPDGISPFSPSQTRFDSDPFFLGKKQK